MYGISNTTKFSYLYRSYVVINARVIFFIKFVCNKLRVINTDISGIRSHEKFAITAKISNKTFQRRTVQIFKFIVCQICRRIIFIHVPYIIIRVPYLHIQ